ncbi:cytochrome c biogenesis protein ResB [Microbacterium esteraromaticum]|uniref:cytochrome c biogenesis protein ResB n=1 Tax=Microbacterium esteraromaticum TaxID=57043 RepID=UPI001F5D2154|nr:cytochrome c biogenesis protein ResB [Microbacterium esteraromaticum]
MRTALLLLLLLALAAVPGSLVPQRSSNPNGVIQYFKDEPDLAELLDNLQLFDVFSSVWFSSIYLLLFLSLIGCVLPRTKHHFKALRTPPPRTPARLERLPGIRYAATTNAEAAVAIESARALLKKSGYRVRIFEEPHLSVSAERGYLRETGNLVFHTALIGVLISVGVGGGFTYTGQRVMVEGQPFVNTLSDYSSFTPGRFFDESMLPPFHMVMDDFSVEYEEQNLNAFGFPTDYTADMSITVPGEPTRQGTVKVNQPLPLLGSDVFLLGNGYAPRITVTDGDGNIAFTDIVPFLPQDANLTSMGFIKAPDALPQQIGMIGFFYPTVGELSTGAFTSVHADLLDPLLTLNVYTGDLGVDDGVPQNVYALDVDGLTQVAGGDTGVEAIKLRPGETASLPNGLGTVTFEDESPGLGPVSAPDFSDSVLRFATFDITHDPSRGWVLAFTLLAVGGLMTALFVPRRRMWVKAVTQPDGGVRLEYAGLARGHDPTLEAAIDDLKKRHLQQLNIKDTP